MFAGCSGSTPVVTGTPLPVASTAPTETPTEAPTETPAATPTPATSATPTPVVTPTPAPTVAPPVATPQPIVGDPTTCTGWDTVGAEFTKAVARVRFDVYCGVMPSSWHVSSMSWELPHGSVGKLSVVYSNKSKTQTVTINEGNFCPGCAYVDVSDLGSANFGNLPGTLKLRAAGQYSIYVNPGANIQYQAVSKGITQSAFTIMMANLVKISKP
jgi:hypothetical protein